jgi:hypothetical protein
MTLKKLFQVHDGFCPVRTLQAAGFDLAALFDNDLLYPTVDRQNVGLTTAGIAGAAGIVSSFQAVKISGQAGSVGTAASISPPLPIV